ncbi:glycoside hydrolase family 79 protein [Mycena polygramma]|nr:glycoside hydrolase family 79 protein [Mycena polygramma]
MVSTILWVGRLCCLALVRASITIYSQEPYAGTHTGTANVASFTGAAAYDPTILLPPPIPNPLPPMQFTQALSSIPPPGVSIPQCGYFYGFSIEFSVINQILGINGSFLQVPFLNLMSNLQARGGSVRVRVGGNTQETATMVSTLPDGKMMEKKLGQAYEPVRLLVLFYFRDSLDWASQLDTPQLQMFTPPLLYTPEVVYMLANISSLVNVQWYLGIPLNDTQNLRLKIAEVAETVLGTNLLGLQVGNEPDQYGIRGHRPITYSPADYSNDFGIVDTALQKDPRISSVAKKLIGPSISGNWKLEDVWDTGFVDKYEDSFAALSVEFYPSNDCAKVLHTADPTIDPQQIFSTYLNHTAATSVVNKYLNSTLMAQSYELPFVMFETNTASCGGFAGVSDSFGSALWALDYGLQLAYSNFTTALLHIGGQSVYYNPFTPPPTNQSTFHSWTIGPVYYSALIVAEVFGKSNQSRIIDLQMNNDSIYTPGYAVYENDTLSRLALINYITDPSGNSDYTATFFLEGETQNQVKVKYLVAPSVSDKGNITWAGQTFGSNFASDGRLTGKIDIQTIPCDTSAKTCSVRVPAPGFALVFLHDPADDPSESPTAVTWATTAHTKTTNTFSVDPSVLATSNGHWGVDKLLGSTSPGRKWWLSNDGPHRNHKSAATDARGGSIVAFVLLCFGVVILALC